MQKEDYRMLNEGGGIYYSSIPKLWPYKLVGQVREGTYQGTHYFLLKNDEGKYAVVNMAFGSCSYCDWLSGTLNSSWGKSDKDPVDDNNIDEVYRYAERKRKQIQWKEADKLADDLQDKDNMSYNWRKADFTDFIKELEEN